MTDTAPVRLVIYSLEDKDWACAQLRIMHPISLCSARLAPVWGTARIQLQVAADIRLIDQADVVLFQRSFPIDDGEAIFEQALETGKPVLLDMDDNLFEVPDTPYFRRRKGVDPKAIARAARRAHAVSVSTERLADRVRKEGVKDVRVLPNCVLEGIWARGVSPRRRPGVVRIGFMGTPTHEEDLALIEDVLVELAERHKGKVEMVFFGCLTPKLRKIPGVVMERFDGGYLSFARTMQSLGLDVAVAPLAGNEFNRCKSNVKWLEYSMARVAGVYSDLPPYSGDVVDGDTGFLATTPEQWSAALNKLVEDAELRGQIAANARAAALERYSMQKWAAAYEAFWTEFV